MSFISRLEKNIKQILVIVLVNIVLLWASLLVHQYYARSSFESMLELARTQAKFNERTVSAIESLTKSARYNFGFIKTNKALIRRIVETEIPDEVALLGRYPTIEKGLKE